MPFQDPILIGIAVAAILITAYTVMRDKASKNNDSDKS
jgi:hypothetical protein